MKFIKHSEQQEGGSFTHYVVFGDQAPWTAPANLCVQCASEAEADKLMSLLTLLIKEAS